jgi:tetratricopeptide (TPR) repeat protein
MKFPYSLQPRLFAFILTTALLSGCTHFVCPDRGGPPWRELKNDHFVLQTDLDPDQARQIFTQLELMRAALLNLISKQKVEEPGPLKTIAFARQSDFAEYTPVKSSTGLFKRSQNGEEVMIFAGDLDSYPRRIIAHELAHYLSFHTIGRQPLWFSEGLASYFETVGDGKMEAGALQQHYWLMIREEPTTARKALEWQQARDGDAYLYAMSWLLVHYLIDKHPAEFTAFQSRLARGEAPNAAWDAVFPEWSFDVPDATKALDQELDTYRLVANFRSKMLEVNVNPAFTERLLTAGEVHTIRLEWKHEWRPADLQHELAEVLTEDPGHIRALMAVAERDQKNAEALARKGVNAHPEDPRAWRFLGNSLLNTKKTKEQEAAFRKALELAPDRPQYLLDLAMSLSFLNKTAESLPLFRRASQLAPWSWFTLCNYARAMGDQGTCGEASNLAARCLEMLQGESLPDRIRLPLVKAVTESKEKCRSREVASKKTVRNQP